MALLGNRFMLSKDGVPVAAVVTHDVNTEAASIEKASATQGKYREYVPGRKQFTIKAEWLMVSSAVMLGLLQTGQTFAVSSYDRQNERRNVHGIAKMEACNIQLTRGTLVHGQFALRGSGYLFAQMSGGDFNFDFNDDFLI